MTSPTTSADSVKVLRGKLASVAEYLRESNAPMSMIFDADDIETALATITQHAEAGAVAEVEVTERNIAYAIAEYKIWGGQLTPDQAMEDSNFRADCYALAEHITAAIHPAQPASQQGEATGHGIEHYSDGKPVTLNWPMPIENLFGNLEYTADRVIRNNARGAGKTTGHAEHIAKSRSVKQIVPPKKSYPKPDENGNETGPCCAHAYADGWNECRDATLATLPHPTGDKVRGLVEKWRSEARSIPEPVNEYAEAAYGAEAAAKNECADELAAALDQEKNDGR